jgi:AFG3 family protein
VRVSETAPLYEVYF